MSSYVAPTVTVDGVVFRLTGRQLEVLLIRRQKAPFAGQWALPGSYVARHETTTQALARTLQTKAGILSNKLTFSEQLYTFDTPAVQDPRGHAVSVTYYALCRAIAPKAGKGETPTFFAVDALPPLAYQHDAVINLALQRLRAKVMYTNSIYALLPALFTFLELQTGYEAVLGHRLDKRNFRKKFLQLNLVEATAKYAKKGPHRPARLYRFTQQTLQTLSRSFD